MVDKNITQVSEKDACVNEGRCGTPQEKTVVDAGYLAIRTMRTVEGNKVSADQWNNDIMPAVRIAAENLPEDASANEIARAAFPELFAKADALKKEERAHAEQDKAWESAQKLKAMSAGVEAGRQLVQTAKGLWGRVAGTFDGKPASSAPAAPQDKGRWGDVDTVQLPEEDPELDELIAQQNADAAEVQEVGEPVGDEVMTFIPYKDAEGREYQFTGVAFRTFSPEDNGFVVNPITYVAYKDSSKKAVIFEVVRKDDGSVYLQDTGVRVAGETAAIKGSIQLSGRWDGRIDFPPYGDAMSEDNPFADVDMVP